MASLHTLNEYLLQRVLFFVSNVPDFENAARSCQIFHHLLKEDETWKYCPRKRMVDVSGHRGSALKWHYMSDNSTTKFDTTKRAALHSIREHQLRELYDTDSNDDSNDESDDEEQHSEPPLLHFDGTKHDCDQEKNYFIKVLGVEGWIKKICGGPIEHYVVRGNTLSVLCHLVQQHVIDTVKQAIRLAVHRTSESHDHPILKKVDILLVSELAEHMTPGRKQLRIFSRNQPQFHGDTVTTDCRNNIAHHLSRMAGATLLEYGTHDLIWKTIMEILSALITFTCHRYSLKPKFSFYADCSKEDIDLYNDPVPIRVRNHHVAASMVPREIEEAAHKLGLSYDRVYGAGWLLSEGRTVEEEMEAAKEDYFFTEDGTVSPERDDDTSTGSMSISDEESGEDYSVYSDDQCPDF